MHQTALNNMQAFKQKYIQGPPGIVLDIGSLDINGSFREIWQGWDYRGIDIVPGQNVDYVTEDPYRWAFIDDESVDVVISGQMLEHVEDDAAIMREAARVLKRGGLCCMIAPSAGPVHDYPMDYRRYTPEMMRELAGQAGLEVLEARINGVVPWFDCIVIARKGGPDEIKSR